MAYTRDTHALTCAATFHPATPEGPGVDSEDAWLTRPYVKIGDVLVFVYADRDDDDPDGPLRLRVSIDLDDIEHEHPVPVEVTCQGETVWSAEGTGSIVNTPEPDRCDRCGAQDGRTVHVGQESTHGFDGLCDQCLDLLNASRKG